MGQNFGRVIDATLANFINSKGHSDFNSAIPNNPTVRDRQIATNIINELMATIPDYDEFDNFMNPHQYNWLWESAYPFTNQWIETLARRYTSHKIDGDPITKPQWEGWQGKLLMKRASPDDEYYETYIAKASTNMPYLDIMYISLVDVWDDDLDNVWINNFCCPVCGYDYKLKDTSAEPTIWEFTHRIQLEECPKCSEVRPTWAEFHKDDAILVYNLRVFGGSNQYVTRLKQHHIPKHAEEGGAEWVALYGGNVEADMTDIKDIDYFNGWYDATPLITNILGFRTWPFINWATTPLGDS